MPERSGPPVVALVPLRTGGKSRLGTAIGSDARDALVLAMLDDVLAALAAAGVHDVRILAGNTPARAAALARGLPAIEDPSAPVGSDAAGTGRDEAVDGPLGQGDAALRRAVDAGLAAVGSDRVRLVVAADLPRISGTELLTVLDDPADVVVVPTRGGGTAVLRLAAGVELASRYGAGSAQAHLAVAGALGLRATRLDLAGARHDVDGAGDLRALPRELDGTSAGPATAALLPEGRG